MEQKDRYSFRSMFERLQKSKPIGKIDEKSSSIWKPVTIGSFSAIMFSTISAVVMKQLEEMNREVHSVLKAKPSFILLSADIFINLSAISLTLFLMSSISFS